MRLDQLQEQDEVYSEIKEIILTTDVWGEREDKTFDRMQRKSLCLSGNCLQSTFIPFLKNKEAM